MNTKQMDLTGFTEIIGSGGFGMIVKHENQEDVIKLFYRNKDCQTASEESSRHLEAYKAIKKITKERPGLQISTSQPIAFRDEAVQFRDTEYRCAYVMKYMESIPGYKLIHIILKDEYERMVNRNVGRSYMEPISDANPSRGFFATSKYIENNILPTLNRDVKGALTSVKMIANRMGMLYGTIIFGTKMVPIDAEYVLDIANGKLNVAILDFGMFQRMDLINFMGENHRKKILGKYVKMLQYDVQGIDLYFPEPDSEYWNPFMDGVKTASRFFIPSVKNKIERESLQIIAKHLINNTDLE